MKIEVIGARGKYTGDLLSAAPDLLAVLRDVREAWLAGRIEDVEGILTGDVCRDVIAKATGEVL
jgi:hypothetical protein